MKVFYISYDGMTDPLGQSQVIPYLEGLAKEGFKITLLSCEKKIPYQKHKNEIAEQLKKAGIKWEVVRYSKRPPVFSTVYDLLKLRRKAYNLHKKEKFQIIHCRSYISAFIGLWMKRKFGTRFIFDMRGFWADERVEGGIWDMKNPLYKMMYQFFKKKEKEFLGEADHIVSLTHKGKAIIQAWHDIPGQPLSISVIPCCVDTEHFNPDKVDPDKRLQLKERLGVKAEDKFLTYLGSVGTWYMVKEMLLFFKELKKEHPEYRFLFITKDDPMIIEKEAKDLEIPKESIIITASERKELPVLLSISSFAISFIRPSFSKSASSPTKLGELFSMGIPVICNKGVGDVDVFYEKELPFLSRCLKEPFTFNETEIGNLDKIKLRNMIQRSFSLKSGCVKYNLIYQNLIEVDA